MQPLTPLVLPPSGMGSVAFTVVDVASLGGVPVYGQAVILQVPTQQHFTNVIADTVGR